MESWQWWFRVINDCQFFFFVCVCVVAEPAITGKVAVQCCQSNGCHQRLSWKGSSLARLIPGMSSNHIRGK